MKTKKPLCEVIEHAIRAAVDALPQTATTDEPEYLEAYLEAIAAIKFGLKMRQEELEAEEQ